MSDRTNPELRRVDSDDQYVRARRWLLSEGFREVNDPESSPERCSTVLVAPDGYALRLVFDPKANEPS